ncbi:MULTISPECIES: hypothetical protein [unclassified Psychrobacter]|uniref:hypothetical protein n=1 Tax=unclassified Psychrobacter TaxID=196806 RepID=UPI00078D6CCD|nr:MULTISPECIES: hypothetical protein [unclassified Psychrobacter]AMN50096.1 hypothetical protein AK823_09620 [Psychrobacter sp. P2G3]AMN67966.1 hypothetical protein AK825_09840 [Psychrobacter sp. P11G5]
MEDIKLTTHTTWLHQIGLSEGVIAAFIIGFLGLCGIFITQYFDRKKERRAFLRDKFEELVFKLADFATLVKENEAKRFQGKDSKSFDLSNFSREGGKIEILTILYFSELEGECKAFLQAGLDLCVAQRLHEMNANEKNLDKLEQRQKYFEEIYDSFYNNIKECIPKYT